MVFLVFEGNDRLVYIGGWEGRDPKVSQVMMYGLGNGNKHLRIRRLYHLDLPFLP